jgi:Meiotically Up-regulated Gene 113 (MUG113) protein
MDTNANRKFIPWGYLYVIKDDQGERKLGFSKAPEQRVQTLQVGNSRKLSVEYTLPVRDKRSAEKALQSLFPANHVRGEWFKIQEDSPEHLLLKKVFGIVPTNRREDYLLKQLRLR